MFRNIYDSITGPCVRKILPPSQEKTLYLTFDDGPDLQCTPQVLDLLAKHQSYATFFIIGNKAERQMELTQRIVKEGHSLGDHTIDHDTQNYFKSELAVHDWIERSENKLNDLGLNSIGFRSPLGIKTPALNKVLKSKDKKLILWDVRFYDTRFGLRKSAVDQKLKELSPGSIILLHDTHHDDRREEFLRSLEYLIEEAKKLGFNFLPLKREDISKLSNLGN